jgi:asparagine synthase (glutamine-hydrolysing)
MCGIAGIATVEGSARDDAAAVTAMLGALAHRGPDDQFHVTDGQCVMGARRLAIIDLATGRQPLEDETGSVVVSQNGEIYNYLELRDELSRAGHRFATTGDTETIALLYRDRGLAFVDALRGMFAIAIWDRDQRRLVLARDRLGEKPLYWRLADGRLSWASEPKALLTLGDVEPTVDRVALAQYLQFGYVPAPRTIYQQIRKLPAASILVWDGGNPRIERYWDIAPDQRRSRPFEEDREEALSLVSEAVRLRMRSDVPVGAFLSGGMDSSLVLALMTAASAGPVRTFSIGFEEQGFNELPFAARVARQFGTDHVEDVVRLDAIGLLPKLADTFDEPFADPAALPTLRLAELAAGDLKVVLTGDGGDEAFAGYRRYRKLVATQAAARLLGPATGLVASGVVHGSGVLPSSSDVRRRSRSWASLTALPAALRYAAMVSTFDPDDRTMLLGDARLASQEAVVAAPMGRPGRVLDRAVITDLQTNLPEKLLVKVDRATMAWSLEARAPLLDHRLLEFSVGLSTGRRIGFRGGKTLLRSLATPFLPAEIVDRPKQGFDLPLGTWFRAELGDRFRDLVLADDAWMVGQLDVSVARRIFEDHVRGRGDHGQELWTLLQLELWGRRWASGHVHRATIAA